MAKHRSHSIDFKRQVAREYLAGETLHGLAKRHDSLRSLRKFWEGYLSFIFRAGAMTFVLKALK